MKTNRIYSLVTMVMMLLLGRVKRVRNNGRRRGRRERQREKIYWKK